MRGVQVRWLTAGLAATLAALGSCGGAPSVPGGPGGPAVPSAPGGGEVDPNTCGSYAASESGQKLQAFLEATVALDEAVRDTEGYLKESCAMMGQELGIAPSGDTQQVCGEVSRALQEHMEAGIQAEASLDVEYQPAVCQVDVDAAAQATAECEAQAEAEVVATCEGTCEGTCHGTCEGECVGGAAADGGGAAAGGECAGECRGTCRGECTGTCRGHADVDASAECEAAAEVRANVEAECTPPEVTASFDAGVVVDQAKAEAAVAAIEAGLPRLLVVHAKINGPVQSAFLTWSATAQELGQNAMQVASAVGDQATCVAGQLQAAAGMLAQIQASIDVQVSVSVEVSGSAGASI